ncbi:hypothetical protein ACFE04_028652 [Oxalis oulophora]
MAMLKTNVLFFFLVTLCLLSQNFASTTTSLGDEKCDCPPSGHTPSPQHGSTPHAPSHGGGSHTPTPSTPSHTPTPSTPSHTPSHTPTPSTPSHTPNPPNCGTPPVDPHHGSPPSTPSTPSIPTPSTPTPSTPTITPVTPTPSTPTITPTTPTPAVPTPFLPDPGSFPGTCNFWSNHPTLIWGVLGWFGTVGNTFGLGSDGGLPTGGFSPSMSLPEALSNTRNDGMGALYREGTASLLNSMVDRNFAFTTNQVRDSFVKALHSDRTAGAQAQLFKLANESRLKPRN